MALVGALVASAQGMEIDVLGSPTEPTGTTSSGAASTGAAAGSPTRPSPARTPPGQDSSELGTCLLDDLPKEVAEQAEDILQGAPMDDGPADGKHFGNYEGLLPRKPSSYYREYTVRTPGLGHRGERRLVVGGGTRRDPDVWYYTGDHFESFCTIPDAER